MPGAYEYSRSFFQRYYTPDDCTVFAVGDVDHDALLALVKAAYGGWTGRRSETQAKPEPPQTAPRTRALTWKGPTLPRLMEGFKVPETRASLADAAALAVVAAVSFGESSDLYQQLVIKEQKLLELESSPDDVFSRDPGLFTVTAKLKTGTTFDEVAHAVEATLSAVAGGETPAARLEATRNHLLNRLTLSLQTPQNAAVTLAAWTAWTGDVHGLEAYRAALTAVTGADVARVARTYLVPARRNLVTLSPAASPVAPPKPAAPRRP
jgi:zinc protease